MCECKTDPEPTPPRPSTGRDHVTTKSISGAIRAPSRRSTTPPPPMKVLIADDDTISVRVLETTLRGWGHEVVVAHDGTTAWEVLQRDDSPRLALIDWMMPGLEGPEVCRRARAQARPVPTYTILLTAKGKANDVVVGLESGADDFVSKPFDRQELRSRMLVGERMIDLQQAMADRVHELETALGQVKQLSGLLPICAYCKKVRDDQNYWQRVETYISAHSDARFSHGICPDCWTTEVEPDLAARGLTK